MDHKFAIVLMAILCCALTFEIIVAEENAEENPIVEDSDLLVGAFNVQIFGKNKMKKKGVVDVLCKIIPRYDLLLIQEIRDSSQTAFASLVERLNIEAGIGEEDDPLYEFVTGRRVGRSSSKEQYGFIYRTDKLTIVQMYESNDDEEDVFEREPLVVRFRRTTQAGEQRSFTFIPMHAKPDDAVREMSHLVGVYDESTKYFGMDAVIAGDLNAGCSYVCKSCWKNCALKNDKRFKWMITDDVDTTVGKTDCAYDRIILAGDEMKSNSCCARIFRFDHAFDCDQELAEHVSDHYPVEFIIH